VDSVIRAEGFNFSGRIPIWAMAVAQRIRGSFWRPIIALSLDIHKKVMKGDRQRPFAAEGRSAV